MGQLNQADWALLAVAGYIAVVVLVQMMRARRDKLLTNLRDQMRQEHDRKLAEEKRQQAKTARSA
jgi:high-affinity Fe2+/Pb2+ permease